LKEVQQHSARFPEQAGQFNQIAMTAFNTLAAIQQEVEKQLFG
jgi:hypothetical protein